MIKMSIEVSEANGNGKERIKVKGQTVEEAFNLISHRMRSIYNLEGGWLFVYLLLAIGASGVLGLKDFLDISVSNLFIIGFIGLISAAAFIFLLFSGEQP